MRDTGERWGRFRRALQGLRALVRRRPRAVPPPPPPGVVPAPAAAPAPRGRSEAAPDPGGAPWSSPGVDGAPAVVDRHVNVQWGVRVLRPPISIPCPRCGEPLTFPVELLRGAPQVSCARCGLALDVRRPVDARRALLDAMSGPLTPSAPAPGHRR